MKDQGLGSSEGLGFLVFRVYTLTQIDMKPEKGAIRGLPPLNYTYYKWGILIPNLRVHQHNPESMSHCSGTQAQRSHSELCKTTSPAVAGSKRACKRRNLLWASLVGYIVKDCLEFGK